MNNYENHQPKAITHQSKLVIGVSARALFQLEDENQIFEDFGPDQYRQVQRDRDNIMLNPGTAFPLVSNLLGLNKLGQSDQPIVEVIIMSQNSPDIGFRILKAVDHYGLDISRLSFSSGQRLDGYLKAFDVDLFLSRSEESVKSAIRAGIPAALIYDPPEVTVSDTHQIRIAFDGDAVLFSPEAEVVFKFEGLDAFIVHEQENAQKPLPDGPLAKFFKALSYIQNNLDGARDFLRIALVTARNSHTFERVIRTFDHWDVHVDEAFFLGGRPKDKILAAFKPHIFFDDQENNCLPASKVAPSAQVIQLRSQVSSENGG